MVIKIIENSLLVISILMFCLTMYISLPVLFHKRKYKHDYDWDNIEVCEVENDKTYIVKCKKCGNTCFSWSLRSLKDNSELNIRSCIVKDKKNSGINRILIKIKLIKFSPVTQAFAVAMILLMFNVFILKEIEPVSIFYIILYFLLVALFTLEKIRKELKAICQIKQ